jgi:Domain of unknown function (DUF4129)
MEASNKKAALRFFSLTAAAAIAIAAGLPSLRFDPGMPLPEAAADNSTVVLPGGNGGVAIPVDKFLVTVIVVILSAIVLLAAIRKIMGLNWKDLRIFLGKALIAVIGFSLFLLLLFNLFPRGTPYAPKPTVEPPQPVSIYEGEPMESPPPALLWIVAAVTAALVIALGLRLFTGKGEARKRLDLVGLEAQAARLALLGGRDFKDAIVDCYRRMIVALQKERGIERNESMTAREFEGLLEGKGVPRESVHKLTLLFESARYGSEVPSPEAEGEAIRCLEAIERYARGGKKT